MTIFIWNVHHNMVQYHKGSSKSHNAGSRFRRNLTYHTVFVIATGHPSLGKRPAAETSALTSYRVCVTMASRTYGWMDNQMNRWVDARVRGQSLKQRGVKG